MADSGTEVNAVHREQFVLVVAVLMGAHLHRHHVALQQGRQDGAGYAFVLHQVFEHNVVNGIGYRHGYKGLFSFAKIMHIVQKNKKTAGFFVLGVASLFSECLSSLGSDILFEVITLQHLDVVVQAEHKTPDA